MSTASISQTPAEITEADKKLDRNRWLLLLLLLLLLFFFGLYMLRSNVPPSAQGVLFTSNHFVPRLTDADLAKTPQIKIVLNPPTLPIQVLDTHYQCRGNLCMYHIDLLNKHANDIQIDGNLYALKRPTHIVGGKALPIIMKKNETRKYTGALTVTSTPEGIMLYIEQK